MSTVSKRKSNKPLEAKSIALTPDQVEGDSVSIGFLPLAWLKKHLGDALWGRNQKRHDIGGVYQSIKEYGFVDPPKWDDNLNEGRGGIVFGNGRTKAIVQALIELQNEGGDPPKGIPVSKIDNDWVIPIKFGVDCESEAKAIALGFDHNNLTLTGGDFDHRAIQSMYDGEGYVRELAAIAQEGVLTVTVDAETLGALMATDAPPLPDDNTNGIGGESKEIECPNCGHTWSKR